MACYGDSFTLLYRELLMLGVSQFSPRWTLWYNYQTSTFSFVLPLKWNNFSETGSCLRLQVGTLQVGHISGDILTPFCGPNCVGSTWSRRRHYSKQKTGVWLMSRTMTVMLLYQSSQTVVLIYFICSFFEIITEILYIILIIHNYRYKTIYNSFDWSKLQIKEILL
jgi:hypothetical protein